MIQLGNQSKVQAYGTLLELESRARAFEGLVTRLKDLMLDRPAIIPPEVIATIDDLAWQIRHSAKLLPSLEDAMGVQRNRIRRGSGVKGGNTKDEAFRGNTRSIAITEVLGLLCAQRKTGTLWIKTDEEMFLLEFSDGAVVHAATNRPSPENRLGTILVAQHKVSKDRLEEAVNEACDRPLGEAMLEAKLVSEHDLRDALEHQVQELFHRVYSLQDARFAFRDGAQSDLEKRVCLSTTQLMLESARTSDERALAETDGDNEVLSLRESDDDETVAELREDESDLATAEAEAEAEAPSEVAYAEDEDLTDELDAELQDNADVEDEDAALADEDDRDPVVTDVIADPAEDVIELTDADLIDDEAEVEFEAAAEVESTEEAAATDEVELTESGDASAISNSAAETELDFEAQVEADLKGADDVAKTEPEDCETLSTETADETEPTDGMADLMADAGISAEDGAGDASPETKAAEPPPAKGRGKRKRRRKRSSKSK